MPKVRLKVDNTIDGHLRLSGDIVTVRDGLYDPQTMEEIHSEQVAGAAPIRHTEGKER